MKKLLLFSLLVTALFKIYFEFSNRPKILIDYSHSGAGDKEAMRQIKLFFNEFSIKGVEIEFINDKEKLFYFIKKDFFPNKFNCNNYVASIIINREKFPKSITEFIHQCPLVPKYFIEWFVFGRDREALSKLDPEIINNKSSLRDADVLLLTDRNSDLFVQKDSINRLKVVTSWYPVPFEVKNLPEKITYIAVLGAWNDGRRDSIKFKEFYQILDTKNYTKFYGTIKSLGELKKYFGYIKTGKVIDTLNEAGVALVLHSGFHFDDGVPSGRIFEAAAAHVVIISDKNKFVIENFGDSVLYIDTENITAREIADQIEEHMNWIIKHPEEAKKLADKAHNIFLNKFSLERQFRKLVNIHNSLSLDKPIVLMKKLR